MCGATGAVNSDVNSWVRTQSLTAREAIGDSRQTGGTGRCRLAVQGGKMAGRVLLIEDEVNIAEAIRFLLTRDGWAVDTHADGASAIARIREVRPDILVLDVMLPGRSG